MANFKTTVAGILVILISALAFDPTGDVSEQLQIIVGVAAAAKIVAGAKLLSFVAAGGGLILAKDHNATGGDKPVSDEARDRLRAAAGLPLIANTVKLPLAILLAFLLATLVSGCGHLQTHVAETTNGVTFSTSKDVVLKDLDVKTKSGTTVHVGSLSSTANPAVISASGQREATNITAGGAAAGQVIGQAVNAAVKGGL